MSTTLRRFAAVLTIVILAFVLVFTFVPRAEAHLSSQTSHGSCEGWFGNDHWNKVYDGTYSGKPWYHTMERQAININTGQYQVIKYHYTRSISPVSGNYVYTYHHKSWNPNCQAGPV